MSIPGAFVAFFEALDGGRSGSGRAPAAPAPSPVQAPPPPLATIENLLVRVADLETQLKTIKPYVDEEVERARRHVEGLRSTVRRITKFLEGGDDEPDAGEGLPGGDAPAGPGGGVLPMRSGVESPHHPSPHEVREAARRALGS